MTRQRGLGLISGAALVLLAAVSAFGQIGPENVLVVCNTASDDSRAIRDAYQARYPAVKVFNYSGSTAMTIDRATYEAELRAPLDAHLRGTPPGDDGPLYETIRVLLTTKGVPRRIDDVDTQGVGDNPSLMLDEFQNGRFDAASVDSELTVLHQQWDAGGAALPDHYGNNHVRNPYHGSEERIDTTSRAYALSDKTLNWSSSLKAWQIPNTGPPAAQLTPGDLYLVCRLSAYTAAEALDALSRAGSVTLNRNMTTAIIDRSLHDGSYLDDDGPYSEGADYPQTRDLLQAAGFNVVYDEGPTFLTTAPWPLFGYASYGVNHADGGRPASTYLLTGLDVELHDGAVFNTLESFNARDFESADPHDAHGQVADWIRIGGTLGVGHVWEPLSFAVADNEILYDRLLVRGWTFAEAAYAALPVVSWQNVVIGDPLTTFTVVAPPKGEVASWTIVADHGTAGSITTSAADGYVDPRVGGVARIDVTLSRAVETSTVTPAAVALDGQLAGDLSALIESVELSGTEHTAISIRLAQPLPDGDRYTLSLTDALRDGDDQPIFGDRALEFAVLAGDADGSGSVTDADLVATRGAAGSIAETAAAGYDVDRSGTVNGTDMLMARSRLGNSLP